MYSLIIYPASYCRARADPMGMRKSKSPALRVASTKSEHRPSTNPRSKPTSEERPQGLDEQTTAESSLNALSKGKSETELAALDEIETSILVAQALLKSIGCAVLRNLPADF